MKVRLSTDPKIPAHCIALMTDLYGFEPDVVYNAEVGPEDTFRGPTFFMTSPNGVVDNFTARYFEVFPEETEEETLNA